MNPSTSMAAVFARSAVVVAALHVSLVAQSTLRTFSPPLPLWSYDRFGSSVAAVGDVNGDGIGDYAAGSSQDLDSDTGRVSIVSGLDGSPLVQVWGWEWGQEFGEPLMAVGDVDGDGVTDLLTVGSGVNSASDPGHSEVRLFSTQTGATLWSLVTVTGSNYNNATHRLIGGGEDVDGDGIDDYGVAGFWSNSEHTVRIYSGVTKQVILTLGLAPQGPAQGPFAMLGDLDSDGKSEIAYTATPGGNWVVHICSGATGTVLRTCVPSPPLSITPAYRTTLVALGDVDGDGTGDLALGAGDVNRVLVFSGATAALISSHTSSESGAQFGLALAGRVDADGDGVGDLVVGAPYADDGGVDRGAVSVFSGRTGALIETTSYGDNGARAGSAVASAGDANGDGFGDFLVGVPFWGSFNYGRLWLHSPCPVPARAVGAAKQNSLNCLPVLSWTGSASASSTQPFDIAAALMLNQKTGTFFYGLGDAVAIPFQGGTQSVPPPRRRTAYQSSGGSSSGSDCSGAFAIDFNQRIQSGVDPALTPGARVVGQYWSRDPADPFTTNLTSGVEFVICP